MTEYMYIFVRTDIPVAYQMVQVGHATFEAGKKFSPAIHPHFVLLPTANQEELLKLAVKLEDNNIEFVMFHEPDNDTGYTALATKPISGDDRSMFKRYKTHKPV